MTGVFNQRPLKFEHCTLSNHKGSRGACCMDARKSFAGIVWPIIWILPTLKRAWRYTIRLNVDWQIYGGLFVFLFLIFLIVIFLFIYFYFCLVISFIILILLLLAFIHISISFSTLNFLSFYYLAIFVFCSFIDLLLLLDLLNVYAFLCQFIGWHFHKYTCVYINNVWIIVCIHFTNIWLTILLSNLPFRFTGKSNVHL